MTLKFAVNHALVTEFSKIVISESSMKLQVNAKRLHLQQWVYIYVGQFSCLLTVVLCSSVCQGVEGVGPILHKGNIDSFVNCEVVQGSIHIDHLSFTGYPHPHTALFVLLQTGFCLYSDALNGIQALTVADLNKLSHVTEIEGYLAVTNTTQMDFNSLQFLESLHAIRGRFTPFGGRYSLYIVGNSHLRSLRTTALERIDRGDVKITDNGQLCYVDTVNWTEIARALLTNGSNGIEVTNNQNRTICGTFFLC